MNRITVKCLWHFLFIMIACLLIEAPFASRGFAAVHRFTATGSYEMGETDSILVAKQKALDEAKRNAAEQAGVYVESETVVENNKVTKDAITLMTAQVLHLQGEPVWSRAAIGDFGTRLTVTIQAYIDDDDLLVLRKRMEDKLTLKKYEELQANYNKLQEDNRKLNLQLETMKREVDRKRIIDALSSNEAIYQANNYITQFTSYDMSAPDFISKGRDLLHKVHSLLDPNVSKPAAIPLYLDLGIDELTLETCQDTKTILSFNDAFKKTSDPARKDQLRDEFLAHKKSQAQRYDDISAHYIQFAESLPDQAAYVYKKYSAMETYYGYRAIALTIMGDRNGASKAIAQAEHCLSRIPKTSVYYKPTLESLQAIKVNIRVQ